MKRIDEESNISILIIPHDILGEDVNINDFVDNNLESILEQDGVDYMSLKEFELDINYDGGYSFQDSYVVFLND